MHVLKVRIQQYVVKERQFPPGLGNLPKLDGYDSEIVDGWGRPFLYSISNNCVRICSLGEDGLKASGSMQADIEGVFTLNPSKVATEDRLPWDLEPEIK
jgi:hypothetical protein